MSNNIIAQHQELFARFQSIEAFIGTKFAQCQRTTLKELARKIKVPYDQITVHLNQWLNYAIRHEANSNMIHKLGVFFTDQHQRPMEFKELNLSTDEKRRIHLVSRQWDLPGYTYIKLLKDLMIATPESRANIKEQLVTSSYTVLTNLQSMGLVHKEEANTPIDWDQFITPLRFGNGGNTPVYKFTNGTVDIWMHWARKTHEQHEAHKAIVSTDQEIICLAPDDETTEQRTTRKEACDELNKFVSNMATMGLILTNVTTQTDFNSEVEGSGRKKFPTLHFTNPNDAMVDVMVKFLTFGEYGKFILN